MNNRVRLTMAQALLRFLEHQGVERDGVRYPFVHGVLGIFGHGNVLGLGEALEQHASGLSYILAHNEQGMVHTATAFAKQQRRLGIYACTSSIGPGALNMVTGAALATVNRLPVLLLPGDIFSDRQPDPVLQQLEHPIDRTASVNDAFKPVSVFWDRILRPEQILASLPEAMAVLVDPAATGAVTLCLPQDVQTQAYDYPMEFFQDRTWSIPRAPVDPQALKVATSTIAGARHPLIVAGGGVIYSDAAKELHALAATCHIPVMETQAGKGSLPGDDPWNLGGVGVTGSVAANRLAREADLIIAVGTRLSDFTTASKTLFSHPDVRFIALNVNRRDAGKLNSIALVGDAKAGLAALTHELSALGYRSAHDPAALKEQKAEWEATVQALGAEGQPDQPLAQTAALLAVEETISPDAIVVAAAGSLPGDLHRLWHCREPHTYHLEYGFSCMGYEVAGALGVKWAEPEREVYALVGDGSFLLLHSELLTSVEQGTKITVVLFDNGGFGSINSLQKAHGSGGFGTEFRSLEGSQRAIDFRQLAESLGVRGYTATTADELKAALRAARAETRSCLIDVKVAMGTATQDSEAWWRVAVAEESSSPAVRAAQASDREHLEKARW